jgi:hypothetical protein
MLSLIAQVVHEWLGLAFGAGVTVHLLLHWKWIMCVVRRFFSKLPGRVRVNSLLKVVRHGDPRGFPGLHDLENGVWLVVSPAPVDRSYESLMLSR